MPELRRKIGHWPGLVMLSLMLVTIPFMAASFWHEWYQVRFTDAYVNYPFGSEEAGANYASRDTYLVYCLRIALVASCSTLFLVIGIWPYRIRWGWVLAAAVCWIVYSLYSIKS